MENNERNFVPSFYKWKTQVHDANYPHGKVFVYY